MDVSNGSQFWNGPEKYYENFLLNRAENCLLAALAPVFPCFWWMVMYIFLDPDKKVNAATMEKKKIDVSITGVFLFSHCYSIRSNLKKMGPLQFCLPVFLGIHRNPKQKDFFNLFEEFFRYNIIYPHLSAWISAWTEPETYFG